jgi:L-lysine 6-transaminase
MLAFDLPTREWRDAFYHGLFELGLLAVRCGDRSIRFRPVLDTSVEVVGRAMGILRAQIARMSR